MFNLLGARLTNASSLKVTLDLKNSIGEPICVVIDPSHIVKLVRNCIGDLKLIYTSDGQQIHWRYIENLHDLQKEEGLHLSTRLRTEHVYYHMKKMKVYLATQVLSKSVADAIEFCDKVLKNEKFHDSSATSKFLRIMDRAFDLLNSKLPFNHRGKIPLSAANQDLWKQEFEDTKSYIMSLHHEKPVVVEDG